MTTLLEVPPSLELAGVQTGRTPLEVRAEVDRLNQEAFKLCRSDPPTALALVQTSRELSLSLGYTVGLGFGWRIAAIAYSMEANFALALQAAQTSLELYRQSEDRRGEASILGNFAILYAELCDYKTALEYYQRTIALLEAEVHDSLLLANTLGNLASVYMIVEQYATALEYYQKALNILAELGGQSSAASPLAFLLNGQGNCYLKLAQYEPAQSRLFEALEVVNPQSDYYRWGSISYSLGQVYRHLQQFEQSAEYLAAALGVFQKVGDKRGVAGTLLETGRLQLAAGQPDAALACYEQALSLVNEVGLRDWVYQVHEALAEFYRAQGDFAQALEHYELFAKIKAEVNTSDNQKALSALQIRFELENAEKEREIFRLRNIELTEALDQLEVANRQIQTYMQALQRELQTGQQIQADFLPESLPQLEAWEMAASFQPAREVAGDFYDAFTLPGNLLGLVIADVCDKGVGAALFMSLIRSMVRLLSNQIFSRSPYLSANFENYFVRVTESSSKSSKNSKNTPPATLMIPAQTYEVLNILKSINDYIALNHRRTNMFATMFFGLLDTETGVLSYINAGHDAPIHLGKAGIKARLPRTGPVVGVMPNAKYNIRQVQLEPDDLLFAYSDGIPEALNLQEALFTEERLLELIETRYSAAPLNAEELLGEIKKAVQDFIGAAEPSDDVTMLALRSIKQQSSL
jgi:sigma-B regulation protein RsbU (phosphoserine phosphatase)